MRSKINIFERKGFTDEFAIQQGIDGSRGNRVLNSEIKTDEMGNMYNGELRIDSVNSRGIVKINDTLYKVSLEVL